MRLGCARRYTASRCAQAASNSSFTRTLAALLRRRLKKRIISATIVADIIRMVHNRGG